MLPNTPHAMDRWRPLDESVVLSFRSSGSESLPACLHWRGSLWRVVGHARHWSTWRALPVATAHADGAPATLRLEADFWRFRAQADPLSPVFHFEVRRAGHQWRLVRLSATFDLPARS